MKASPPLSKRETLFSKGGKCSGNDSEFCALVRHISHADRLASGSFGLAFYYFRQYDNAIETHKKAPELDPTFPSIHSSIGLLYTHKATYGESLDEFQKEMDLVWQRHQTVDILVAFTYAKMGRLYSSIS